MKNSKLYKSGTLNLRINPQLKKQAESVLSKLGIPMSTAIDMYLNKIVLEKGIPFNVSLPKPPIDVDLSQMSEEQFYKKIKNSYDEALKGNIIEASKALKK